MVRMVLIPALIVTAGAFFSAPVAAVPDCIDTAPNTRTCATPGHTGITTSPNPAFTNPWPGWGFGFGTPVFGLGGGGVWIGL